MSIAQSNLTRYQGTNVDMAVSVTEHALNSQMRQYLASISTASKMEDHCTRVYILSYADDNGDPVLFAIDKNTDYQRLPMGFPDDFYKTVESLMENKSTLFAELEKLDLFNIASGTKATLCFSAKTPSPLMGDAQTIQTAANYYLKYGLYIEDGIPDSILTKLIDSNFKGNPDTLIKPITLQPDRKNVLFRQFFKNICGIQLSTTASITHSNATVTTTLSKTEQTDNDIWYFPFQISLDFRAAAYSNCSKEVQNKIQQMGQVENPDDVFNISQLALDLQTLSTTMTPTIAEFEHDVDSFLTSIIRTYFDRLEKAGQTVFGSVITTKPSSSQKYLFTPKSRNYHISPRTLNYLIGFGAETTVPNLGNDNNFVWDSDTNPMIAANNPNNAAVAISSAHLLPFIAQMIRPALNFLPNEISVHSETATWEKQFKVWAESEPKNGNPNFSSGGTAGDPLFEYTYHFRDKSDRYLMWQPPIPAPVASLQLTHEYDANVHGRPGTYMFGKTELPAFIFHFNIRGWLRIDYNTNIATKGTYFDQTLEMAIGIRIDSQTGNIDFVKSINKINNNPSGLAKSGWVEFMSANNIKDYISVLVNALNCIMAGIEDYSIDNFIRSVNSQIGFVMPGSKTFTFVYDKPNGKVNAITPNGDLYLYGNYVQEVAK